MTKTAPRPAARGALLLLWALASCTRSTPAAIPGVDAAPANPPSAPWPDAAEPVASGHCGRPPLPPCPLQQWMDANLRQPLNQRRLDRLVVPLQALAEAQPAGYDGWTEAALRGATAAARRDEEGVRAACGGCHRTHRARYRSEQRGQPLAEVLRGWRSAP